MAFFTEYYVQIRKLAKEQRIEDADMLNDTFLFEKADSKTIENVYPDIIAAASRPQVSLSELKGLEKFIADIFGVVFVNSRAEQDYERYQARFTRIEREISAVEGRVYPTRLSPFPSNAKREWIGTIHYIRHYSIWSIIAIFFILSFIGWIWEVCMHMITYGEFVNRGVLHGRICAEGLLTFGIGGMLIVYVLAPLLDNILRQISHRILLPLCLVLILLFVCDQCYSSRHPNTGTGITRSAFYSCLSNNTIPSPVQKGPV